MFDAYIKRENKWDHLSEIDNKLLKYKTKKHIVIISTAIMPLALKILSKSYYSEFHDSDIEASIFMDDLAEQKMQSMLTIFKDSVPTMHLPENLSTQMIYTKLCNMKEGYSTEDVLQYVELAKKQFCHNDSNEQFAFLILPTSVIISDRTIYALKELFSNPTYHPYDLNIIWLRYVNGTQYSDHWLDNFPMKIMKSHDAIIKTDMLNMYSYQEMLELMKSIYSIVRINAV